MVMVRVARAMATMVASDKEGNGDGGKSDVDGDEGGRRETATRVKATAMRAMATVTGVVCDKEARVRVLPKAMRTNMESSLSPEEFNIIKEQSRCRVHIFLASFS